MEITSWEIRATTSDGKEVRLADMPDDVAQVVDDYIGELEKNDFDDVLEIVDEEQVVLEKGKAYEIHYPDGTTTWHDYR